MPKTITNSYLGTGLYSVSEAARLIGCHHAKIRRWAGEYRPIIYCRFKHEGILTFLELMEMHFIHMFRMEGVSMQTIRKTANAAANKFHTRYPFAIQRFDTDGRTIFATLKKKETDKVLVEDLRRGQYVFEKIIRPFFRKLEYRKTREALRFWPMEKKGLVVLDPERKFGKPIDADSGVPTGVIYEAIQAGGGQDERVVSEWLDIPLRVVRAAVRFEKSLKR